MMSSSVDIFGASAKGPAHSNSGLPNQDAWIYRKMSFGSIVCVCDGLGTRTHSDIGSKMACESVIEAVKIWVKNDKALINTLLQLIHTIWNVKIQTLSAYDCATTCLFAVKFKNGKCILAQLGDGLILAKSKNKKIIELENVSEEFSNLTTGLGIAKALSEWNIQEYFENDPLQTIVLCTDGISEDIVGGMREEFMRYVNEKYVPLKGIQRWHKIMSDLKNWPVEMHSDDKTIAVIYEDQL